MNISPRIIGIKVKTVDVLDKKLFCDQLKPSKLEWTLNMYIRPDSGDPEELVTELQKNEGEELNIVIGPDRAKDGREDDGKMGSYWWSVRAITDEEPNSPTFSSAVGTSNEHSLHPGAIWQAHGQAHDYIIHDIWPVPEGRSFRSWLLECRDWIVHNVSQEPVRPANYCYEHDTQFEQGNRGGWGHAVNGGHCVQDIGFVASENKKQAQEPENLRDALVERGDEFYQESFGGNLR